MFKVESLKDYIGNLSYDELMDLANRIYMVTDHMKNDYPEHHNWFFNKQLQETILTDTRNILFVKNPGNEKDIIAVVCLKKDDEETKICTLYVKEDFRNNGIGTELLEEAFKWLGTTKPLTSITQEKSEGLKPIINKYGWELKEVIENYYNYGKTELVYNGSLIKTDNKII